ncbi:MAG: phosphoribosyltransferase family protein [Pseudomonadota bacterium]|nr:phosphoribosyltransferase family protein [Pseudomonadota bacterium]
MDWQKILLKILCRYWDWRDSLFNKKCLSCRGKPAQHRLYLLCSRCFEDACLTIAQCQFCAVDLPSGGEICGLCVQRKMNNQPTIVRAGFAYQGEVKQRIIDLKFNYCFLQARVLAAMLVANMQNRGAINKFDAVIAVPMYWTKVADRGYNQAEILAKWVASLLQIPHIAHALIKYKNTKPQQGMDKKSRNKNIRNTIRAKSVVTGKYILLLDDVLTTGATISTCARMCYQAGAKKVEVWVVARTLSPS